MRLATPLAAACLVAGALLCAAPAQADESPLRYNCPPGFVWVRMSGTGCVQEELPANGRIGYDGTSICNDGYVGIYERRPTTDGKGVPGNPATAFAFLLECLTPQQYQARQSRAEAAPQLGDAASRLAAGGMKLPPGQLVLLGALGTGALIFAAVPTIRRRNGLPAAPPPGGAASSAGPDTPPEPPAQEQLRSDQALDAGELRRRISALDRIDKDLADKIEEYREKAHEGRLTPQDVVTWTGIVADLASLVPGAQLPAGIASLAANVASLIGEHYTTRDLDRAIREGLGAMAQLRGIIDVEREGYRAALAELEQPREPAVPPVPPEMLPDDTLQAERDRAHQRTLDASQRKIDATDAWIEKSNRLREQQRRIDHLVSHLPDLDTTETHEVAVSANVWLDLAAGIDSMARFHQTEPAQQARDAVMRIFKGEAPGAFGEALDRAVDAGAGARGAGAAGRWAGRVSAASAAASMAEWFHARSVEERRVLLERAIESMRYEAGRMQAEIAQAEGAMERADAQATAEAARRRALSTEMDLRAARRGNLLWRE